MLVVLERLVVRNVIANCGYGIVPRETHMVRAANRELGERLERARAETERAFAELGEHIGADREQIETLRAALADGEPKLALSFSLNPSLAAVFWMVNACVPKLPPTWILPRLIGVVIVFAEARRKTVPVTLIVCAGMPWMNCSDCWNPAS